MINSFLQRHRLEVRGFGERGRAMPKAPTHKSLREGSHIATCVTYN